MYAIYRSSTLHKRESAMMRLIVLFVLSLVVGLGASCMAHNPPRSMSGNHGCHPHHGYGYGSYPYYGYGYGYGNYPYQPGGPRHGHIYGSQPGYLYQYPNPYKCPHGYYQYPGVYGRPYYHFGR